MQIVYPNVVDLCRGKTRQRAPNVVARSLGQAEAYLTVREVLAGASTATDGVHWREFSGFGRFRSATLGCSSVICSVHLLAIYALRSEMSIASILHILPAREALPIQTWLIGRKIFQINVMHGVQNVAADLAVLSI